MFAAPQVRSTIKRVDGIMKRKPKEAFDRRRKNVDEVNNNEILDGIRTQKLLKALNRVPVRVMSDTTQRILRDGNKVKGAIKKIYSAMRIYLKLLWVSGRNISLASRIKTSSIT